jgi:hypothetical protein
MDVLNRAVVGGDISAIKRWCEEKAGMVFKDKVSSEDVAKVFEEHTRLTWSGKGRKPSLLREKSKRIRSRLERFTADELITAMNVAAADPFWNGAKNDRGSFLGIENLFLNDARVEKFLQMAADQGITAGDADNVRKLHENRDRALLRIQQIAARMRSGEASLVDKSQYAQRVKELEAEHGLTFDWQTGESKRL